MGYRLLKQKHFSIVQPVMIAGLILGSMTAHAEISDKDTAPVAPMGDFAMPTYQGTSISLNDYLGKVVLVDFWASWCSPCRTSFPWMNHMSAKYRDQGFEIAAINLDQQKPQAVTFLKELPPEFTVLFNASGEMPEAFEVIGMPTSFLIDRDGKVRATHIGFHSDKTKEYEKEIQQLLQEAQ
ncbi:TlpA disulfide reductase family protein [Rhodanobacter aciditrophus]|uniref:TlpA disulfide reductase family protein n=1 Tax=Rhodanobacter aciditrophus TaxID=1623218 RepID=A0ABW4B0I6_9GAMM